MQTNSFPFDVYKLSFLVGNYNCRIVDIRDISRWLSCNELNSLFSKLDRLKIVHNRI